jgi:hypothetical protein
VVILELIRATCHDLTGLVHFIRPRSTGLRVLVMVTLDNLADRITLSSRLVRRVTALSTRW